MNLSDLHNKNKTDARLELLRLGYTPIKLDGKIPTYKGWDVETVDKALITSKEWDRDGKRVNTGIRCVGTQVIGLDVDIADEDLVNDFFNHMIDLGFIDDANHPPVRIGRAPRELWVFRTSGKPMVPRRSASYAADTDKYLEACEVRDRILLEVDEHNVKEMMQRASKAYASFDIETYAIETPRQFAAFGVHPGTGQPFEWPYGDLPPVDELPVLDDLDGVFNLFYELMAGYVQTSSGVSTGTFQHETDQLTGGSVLVTEAHGALTCDEALARFKPGFSCRCAPSAVRKISVDTDNGQLRILRDGSGLQLTDYPAAKVYEYRQGPSDVANKLAEVMTAKLPKLAALITKADAERAQAAEEREERAAEPAELTDGTFDDSDPEDMEIWTENVRAAFENWVLLGGESVYDGVTGCERTLKAMTELYSSFNLTMQPPPETKRQAKNLNLVQAWRRLPDRRMAESVAPYPGKPQPVYMNSKGLPTVNSWKPADLPREGGDAQPMLDHIRWLLPIDDEWRDFMNWLADVVQHRGKRRYSSLMVADNTFGVGRDTMADTLFQLLGKWNCTKIDGGKLLGGSSQSQYNQWLVGHELYTIAEIRQDGASRLDMRGVYDKIKDYMDPKEETSAQIVRKGLPNFEADIYGTFFIASNHSDAIVLPPDDRRLAVYTNPTQPLGKDRGKYLNQVWRADLRNIGALYRYLEAYKIDDHWDRTTPPDTEGKMTMAREGESPLKEVVREVVDVLEHLRVGWINIETLVALMDAYHDQQMTNPRTRDRAAAVWRGYQHYIRGLIKETTGSPPVGTTPARSKINGKKGRYRVVRRGILEHMPPRDISQAQFSSVLEVLDKSGESRLKALMTLASRDL